MKGRGPWTNFNHFMILFCEVNELVPLATYLEKHHKTKRTFKNERERKNYIVNELKLSVRRDPKKNIWTVPVETSTVMLEGHRLSAARVKEEEFNDKDESKEAFKKAKEGVAVSTNTKDMKGGRACSMQSIVFTINYWLTSCSQIVGLNQGCRLM